MGELIFLDLKFYCIKIKEPNVKTYSMCKVNAVFFLLFCWGFFVCFYFIFGASTCLSFHIFVFVICYKLRERILLALHEELVNI